MSSIFLFIELVGSFSLSLSLENFLYFVRKQRRNVIIIRYNASKFSLVP